MVLDGIDENSTTPVSLFTPNDNDPSSLEIKKRTSGTDIGNKRPLDVLQIASFPLAVARGLIPGVTHVNNFGENPDIDTATDPEDVWDFGGVYNFSTTDDIDSISSSDAGDTMVITVEGLALDYTKVSQNVTLTGQTRAALATKLIRVNRAFMVGNVSVVGTVSIYENTALTAGVPTDTTKIRAQILAENNQTLMAIYTVPLAKTAYMLRYSAGLSRGNATAVVADFILQIALFGEKFRIKDRKAAMSAGQSDIPHIFLIPEVIPAKSDIKIKCDRVTADNTSVFGGFTLLLVDD